MVVNLIDARATIMSDWDDSRMIIACEIGAEAREQKNREQQLHTAFARNLATSPPAASRATVRLHGLREAACFYGTGPYHHSFIS